MSRISKKRLEINMKQERKNNLITTSDKGMEKKSEVVDCLYR